MSHVVVPPSEPQGLRGRSIARTWLRWTACSLLLVACHLLPAWGADDVPPPAITTPEVEQALKQVQDSTDLTADAKKPLVELYTKALESLKKADELNTEAAQHRASRLKAPAELEKLKAELAVPAKPAELTIPDNATLDTLKQELAQSEVKREEAEQALAKIEAEIKRRASRADPLTVADAAAKTRLEAIDKQLEALPAIETLDATQRATRATLLAEQVRLRAERAAYAEELPRYEASRDLMRSRSDVATRQVNQAKAIEQQWKDLVAQQSKAEVEDQEREARRTVITTRNELLHLAKENERLAQLRKAAESPGQGLLVVERKASEVETERDQLNAKFKHLESVADLAGNAPQMLLELRAELPDIKLMRKRIADRQTRINKAQFEMINLQAQRASLADLDRRVAHEMATLQPQPAADDRGLVEREIRELLTTQRDLLDGLIDDFQKYLYVLKTRLDKSNRELLVDTQRHTEFIDERILWLASAPPLGPADVEKSRLAFYELSELKPWRDVLRAWGEDVWSYPALYFLAGLVTLALYLPQHWFRRRIEAIAQEIISSYTASFAPTFRALLLTTLIALAWPAVMWFAAWRLASLPIVSTLSDSLAAGFEAAAIAYFTIQLGRQVCRKHGLAEAHFLWPEESVRQLRHNLHWLLPLGSPLAFVVSFMHAQGDPIFDASLGRLAFCAGMVLLTIFAQRVLRPLYSILLSQIGKDDAHWLNSVRFLWYPGIMVVPVLLAAIAILGYYYTALQLGWRAQETLWLFYGLLVGHSLLLRGLLVARRSLAIQQARRRREAAQEQAEEEPGDAPMAEEEPLLVLDLSKIDQQIRSLLRWGFVLTLFLGSWLICVDVLPALKVFKNFELWPYAGGSVTLGNVTVALIVTFMTFIAASNLPGLLEIVWLRHLPLEAGARYAVTTIFRYVITVLGLVVAFEFIGIGWTHVQWLVAAATVGLGFGLQEIFANFISGLILLLERPMRVGDVVTVGGVSGTVARIRFRATTINTGDRKELIVPNKEFITGQLVNWTLTDTMLQQVIRLGIVYGSDTALATRLLREVATANSLVLKDPPPAVLFNEFGENALQFELQYFVAGPGRTGELRHALHMAIDGAFRNANIKIALPQRDIHVRSIDASPQALDQLGRKLRESL